MTHSALLIFNPVAGQSDPYQDLLTIWQLLAPEFRLHIHLTHPEEQLQGLVNDAIASGTKIIMASGGDGTVTAVAQTVMGTGIALGVIPRGTANTFAVSLGIPIDIPGACQVILEGHTRTIDTARCNQQPLILLVGVGFETETMTKADYEAKKSWGTLAYILAGMGQFHEEELFDIQIELAEVISRIQASTITITNTAPSTSVIAQRLGPAITDDGLLEVTITTARNLLPAVDAVADLLGAVLIQTATDRQDIICLRTPRIKLTTDPPQKVIIDGEIMGTTPIEVQCIPRNLILLVPSVEKV